MVWICEFLENHWNDEPRGGYAVHNTDPEQQIECYAYYPNGKDLAEKFADLCNKIGEKKACEKMGYYFKEETSS